MPADGWSIVHETNLDINDDDSGTGTPGGALRVRE